MAGALLVAGCASDDTSAKTTTAESKEKTPEVGMTKDRVGALYGKTNNVHVGNDGGETWVYNMNMGGFIPWNYGYRPRMRIIDFDRNGKVKSWSYSE